MLPAPTKRVWPTTGFMIGVALAMIAVAMWMTTQRTSRVDDAAAGDGRLPSSRWPDMRINVNSAGVAELSLLPGLGDRLAQRIVDDRTAGGPFASLAELSRVPGIGESTIERLRPFATVESAVQPSTAAAGP